MISQETAVEDNLVPRAFPFEIGRGGKSPGNEVAVEETRLEPGLFDPERSALIPLGHRACT